MPRALSLCMIGVFQNAPFPGLSMTTSFGSGFSSSMMSWPYSPRTFGWVSLFLASPTHGAHPEVCPFLPYHQSPSRAGSFLEPLPGDGAWTMDSRRDPATGPRECGKFVVQRSCTLRGEFLLARSIPAPFEGLHPGFLQTLQERQSLFAYQLLEVLCS